MNNKNPTERFSGRVANYAKYRPGYPAAVLDFMKKELDFNITSVIADVGSGTGLLSELFLDNGNRVYGIEPNREMREAAELLLRKYWKFTSIDGRAEATTLKRRSVDFITAGQAFHWFDPVKAREEFARILKPSGWVVLIWNERRVDSSPFLKAFEELLLHFSIDYTQVDHRQVDDKLLSAFFRPRRYKFRLFENFQQFDFTGLKGRLLSSSYVPIRGHANYAPMLRELRKIFRASQKNGVVKFEYDTKFYWGKLD